MTSIETIPLDELVAENNPSTLGLKQRSELQSVARELRAKSGGFVVCTEDKLVVVRGASGPEHVDDLGPDSIGPLENEAGFFYSVSSEDEAVHSTIARLFLGNESTADRARHLEAFIKAEIIQDERYGDPESAKTFLERYE